MIPANQMPGYFSGGDSDISIRASTVTRVALITSVQLLSYSVANDFYEAGETDKRELIQNSEFWFGVHQEEQVAALHKILNLMENITFGGYLKLETLHEIVASTLDLWADLKRKGWGHICNLNQDILELFFMNIRSLGGASCQ